MALLRFLAVGRLVALPDGRWAEGKHQLLCSYAPKDDREVKAYKSHIKAIMNKGANKLQPGKRIRLTSDNNDYDLQVLADHAEDDPSNTLIFFAVTDPSFAKHHTVSALLRDFKKDFYEAVQARDLQAAGTTTTGGLQRQCTPLLQRLYATYNVSKLREVQAKVEKVKSVMKDNVGSVCTANLLLSCPRALRRSPLCHPAHRSVSARLCHVRAVCLTAAAYLCHATPSRLTR